MNNKIKLFLATILSIWLLGASTTASALKPKDITEAEMALIPHYCPDTMGFKYGDAYSNTSPNAKKWVAMMGEGFWHMHHYCWARINLNRAQRAGFSAYHKQALLKDVRGDFHYVVNNTKSDFILLPEIFTWIGRSSILLNEPQEAINAFAKARELKPDYWPPYFHWAELLRSKGKKAEALEVVKASLQHSPGTKTMLVLFRDLGGKPADIPPPIAKTEAATAPEAPNTEETEKPPVPAVQSPTKQLP